MNVKYRLALLEDIDGIMELIKNAVIEMERNNIFQWDELYPAREDFIEDIKHNSLYIGLCEGKTAVVFALNRQCDEAYKSGKWLYPNREYYIVHRLCVNCSFQNKGVGKQTMQFIEDELKAKNIQAVRLDVFSENPFALSLYTHMGYTKAGKADWRKGRFYLMEKYLY